MVRELINAMEFYKEQHGHNLEIIKLTAEQYRQLKLELQYNFRYMAAANDVAGEEERFNGAVIQVV